jgi:PKD repeat protein
MSRPVTRLFALAVVLALGPAALASGQTQDCGVLIAATQVAFPSFSGTLPGSADMTTAGGSSYLYALTQWGVARASLADPQNPGPFTQVIVGQEGGSNNGGLIPILCDCHQGGNNMDAAQAPGGTARAISDWQPFKQGGGGSGLAAQLVQASGAGGLSFGNQISLDAVVPVGARIAAVYLPSSGKYFGYFPTSTSGVEKVDLTSPTGSTSAAQALPATLGIGWSSIDNSNFPSPPSTVGVRLRAARVTAGGYDQYVLVGATKGDKTLHVAEINPTTGALTEVASTPLVGFPIQFDVGVVNGEIFIVSAEGTSGLQIYQFTPPNLLQNVNSMSGVYYRAALRGPAPFPALITHRYVSGSETYIDIHDTKWLTQGGTPLRAKSLRHVGAAYHGYGFEALVTQSGPTLTAYLYRQFGGFPVGALHTDKLDISCIAADPTAPPIPYAAMTNLSAASRPSPENAKNYFGDKWAIADASVSYKPITELDWDFHRTGSFAAEKIQIGASLAGYTYNPAYWPCDMLSGGDITSGAGCYQSLGSIVSTYQLSLNSHNSNGPGAPPYLSPSASVLAPQINIVGYSGNTLQVLAGNPNNGDARGSLGNTAEATFAWSFTPPSGTVFGTLVSVPSNATNFSLTATYKGGYAVTKSGFVQQVELVPNFSLTPNPVLKSTALTLKNLMQIGAAATVTSVSYSINSSPVLSGTLASTFNVPNGTAPVTAPATVGSFTITLTWNYTVASVPKTATASLPFTTTDFTPVPSLGMYKDAGRTQRVFPIGSPLTWSLQQGVTYYLFDDETLPGGVTHPGASFYKSSDSLQSISTGDTQLTGSPTSGDGPATFPASTACSTNCYFKISVPTASGTVRAFRYTVTGGNPTPTPPPPPTPTPIPNGQSVSLATPSPAGPKAGETVTFTAVPANFTGTVSYQWDFGDSGTQTGGCPPIFPNCKPSLQAAYTPGSNPNTHVYATAGTYTVSVQATGDGVTKTATQSVVVAAAGPPPPPSPFYTISGATFSQTSGRWEVPMGQAVTFTATEANASLWVWNFGDGASAEGRTVAHAFTQLGAPNATLTVTGDGTNTSGESNAIIGFTIVDPSVLYLNNRRFEVRASWVSTGQGTHGVGTAVQLTSDTGYLWFFNPANLEVVVKVLDACSVDGYFWVFGGGLTNLAVELTVTDTQTLFTKTYTNLENTAFQPIQDTRFELCPAQAVAAAVAPRAATAATVTLSAPTPATPVVGDTVSFTATPGGFTGTVTYLWNFGDSCPPIFPGCTGGPVAGPATNTHLYARPGTYTVTVLATAGAETAPASQSVTVTEASPTIPHPSAAYSIVGATAGPGAIWSAPVNQTITFTASETHAASWVWDFGNGDTQSGQSVTHTFTAGGSPSVTLTVTGDGTNTEGTSSVVIRFAITDPYTLLVNNGRFAIQVAWSSAKQGTSGFGTATALTVDTGYFWFFNPTNTEVVIKVLDACFDGHFWVFGSGLTDVGVVLTVTDTQSGTAMTYTNPDGSAFLPIQDFVSFSSCGAS